jgi:hypothetical protein
MILSDNLGSPVEAPFTRGSEVKGQNILGVMSRNYKTRRALRLVIRKESANPPSLPKVCAPQSRFLPSNINI